ncbi:MAG TPA: NPCBM/NEW2 domain-containing protein [bacterium]|nr:NPCBM/NEW2 domain-containing protein [bacterium]HPP30014.1 NPCBM/NEW2 domain-containing protein [bacterium]
MAHNTTYDVFDILPKKQKIFWGIEGMSREEIHSILIKGDPDYYCGLSARKRKEFQKYMVVVTYPGDRKTRYGINNKGRLFHYFPVDTDVYEGCGAWQADSTEKWHFVYRGFYKYLTRIIGWLRTGKKKDALISMAGLFHILQDQCCFFHSLEGEEGCSQWILDELIEKPDRCLLNPTALIGETHIPVNLKDYNPVLLGTDIEEICFHLYNRYRQVKSANRKKLIPLVQAEYLKDTEAVYKIKKSIIKEAGELVYDLIYTIYCVATSSFRKTDLKKLERIYLSDIKPVNYPRHSSFPYRVNTPVYNYAIGERGERYPLSILIRKEGKLEEYRFNKGLAMGVHRELIISYAVPKKVFNRFHGYFGIHSRFIKEGSVKFEARFNGKTLLKEALDRENPSVEIDFCVREGGLLHFFIRAKGGLKERCNNLILAEPCLIK